MANVWFASDHHLNHANILTFTSSVDGVSLVRPGFTDVEEMNEKIIERHNSLVKDDDKVYFLGDVGMVESKLGPLLDRMKGKKRLILGNHDGFRMSFYSKYFKKIMLERRMEGLLFSHRPAYLGRHESHIKGNVHGHIHEQNIDDPRYLNLSVEQTNYFPVHMDDVLKTMRNRGII